MKKNLYSAFFLTLAFSTAPVFAAFTPAQLVDASKASLDAFAKDAPDHVAHMTGFKTWKSGEDAKVKVYVDHDGMAMEYDYSCLLNGTMVDCQAQ